MDPRTFVDAALEISVVGSFSRHGFLLRRRLFGWVDPSPGALQGRTALVTGPTSGLGRVVAGKLAALGARVVLAGRTESKLQAVRDELVAAHREDRFPIVVVDMASLASVREAVSTVVETEARLDVLVDNAGAIFPERRETDDGMEATLATMVVGPFVLIGGLLPLLRSTTGSRVIAVTSGGMYTTGVDFDDLGWERRDWSGPRVYAQAKRIQVALVREWARRLGRPGGDVPAVNAMHPGWADTPGVEASLPGFYDFMKPHLRTPEQGADTIVWLAADPAAGRRSGRLYLDRRERPFDRVPSTRLSGADRRRLWDLVVAMSESRDPLPD